MSKILFFCLFLILNFGALALGSWLMGTNPMNNEWYLQLNKAPWTPPGWVFGVAWTSIMLLFTIYLTIQEKEKLSNKRFIIFFSLQFLTNVLWNPIFFHLHWTFLGMIIIFSLFVSLVLILYYFKSSIWKSLFLLPYLIWLTVAFSLNAYSWWMN
jgi:tryptophan-rich sensory protein